MKPRTTIVFAVVWLMWLFFKSPLWAAAPALLPLCGLMACLCLYPLWRWLSEGMTTLPLLAAYALMHIPAYLLPFLQGRPDVIGYAWPVPAKTALATCAYLLSFQVVGYSTKAHLKHSDRFNRLFLHRSLTSIRESKLMWCLLGVWWIFTIAVSQHLLPDFGAAFQVARMLATTPGLLAMFYFFFLYGRGELKIMQKSILLGSVVTGVSVDFTSGYLIGGSSILLLILLAYMMGAKRVPVLALAGCLLLLSFLHLGKGEMRAKYWNLAGGESYSTSRLNPIEVSSFWIGASWRELVSPRSPDEEEPVSLLERSSIAHMLALVISETPANKPFLNAQTYGQIPQLLIPRFVWKDKPRGNLPTETLALYYSLQTEESLETTSVAFGPVAEAWANLGWIGILMIGGVVGFVLSLPSYLAAGCSVNQVGFFMSTVFLANSYNLEMSLGPWLISLLNGLVVATLGLYLLSRPVGSKGATASGRAKGAKRTRTPGSRRVINQPGVSKQ